MNRTISVIIPVYNVASYLPECLNSVLGQNYPHLQVIVVDDGSTDHSGAICDEFAQKDSRIRVIYQKNGGAAAAKNAGLRIASGEYLSFVDSDDYLEPGAYSHMVQLLKKHQADAVQCAYRDVFRNRTAERFTDRECIAMSGVAFLERYTWDWTCSLLWDKLYRREIFDGIFFEEGHKIDDEYFTYRGIINAKRVVCDDRIVYNYRKRASSVMASAASGNQILMDRIDCLRKRRKRIHQEVPALAKEFDLHFLNMLVILSHDPYCSDESIQQIRLALAEYFREAGHTHPPLALWGSLWKVRHLPVERLRAMRDSIMPQKSEEYFA